MIEPVYQEYKANKLPIVNKEGVWARVISGEALGVKGIINAKTPAFYLDIHLQKNV